MDEGNVDDHLAGEGRETRGQQAAALLMCPAPLLDSCRRAPCPHLIIHPAVAEDIRRKPIVPYLDDFGGRFRILEVDAGDAESGG